MSKLPQTGIDTVQRKSLLEQAGIHTKDEYDRRWKAKFRENAPVQIPSADRGHVSPLAGLAQGDCRGMWRGKLWNPKTGEGV